MTGVAPSASERRPRISAVKNVLANWGTFAFAALVNFFLAPIVVDQLGTSSYGLWVLLASVVGYLGLLDFGVRGAVMRYIAHKHAATEHGEAGLIASSALSLFGIMGAVAILMAAILALSVEHLFNIPSELVHISRWVLLIGGVNIAVALVTGVFGGIIAALQRFDLNGWIELTVEAGRACAIFLALRAGYGLLALAFIQLAATAVRGGATMVVSRRLYPGLRISLATFSSQHVRPLLSFSGYSSLIHLSTAIILQADAAIIGMFLPVAMIGYFAVAGNLVYYARSLIGGIALTVTPRASAMQARGEEAQASRIPLDAGRWSTLVILAIAVTFLLRGSTFIHLWMGAEFSTISGTVLRILTLALLLDAGRHIIVVTLMGLNRHKAVVPVFVLEAIASLALSVLLVKRFGIVGVAWGTVLPRVLASAVFIPRIYARSQRLSLWDVWREIWLRPALAIIPFAAVTYLIERSWPATTMTVFFLEVALALPVVMLGAWLVVAQPAERVAFATRIATLRKDRRLRPLSSSPE
ncbi:MAG: oligosaccharide flippase family protein [Longimicrobiales bacterium]